MTTTANWTLSCAPSGSLAVSGVTYYGEPAHKATLTLATLTTPADGATCALTPTAAVKDLLGRSVAAGQTATWRIDTSSPDLLTRAPDGAVASATSVVVTFSEPMDGPALEALASGKPLNFRVESDGLPLPGTVTYEAIAGPVWRGVFVPASSFASGRTYTVVLAPSVTDEAGNSLPPEDRVWSFLVPGPRVEAVSPASGAPDVTRTTSISATFDVAMDATSFTSDSFTVSAGGNPIAGALFYHAPSRTVTFDPTTDLPSATEIIATLTTGARDANGVHLAEAHTWTFSTEATLPPEVVGVSPADGATDGATTTTVSAFFNVAMAPESFASDTFKVEGPGGAVAGTWTYDGDLRRARFTPSSPIASAATFTATLTTGVTDASGVGLTQTYRWTFTTGAPPQPPAVDSVAPASGATAVVRPTTVSAVFNVAMDSSSFNESSFVVTANGATVTGTRSYDDTARKVIFVPSSLPASATCTATLTTAVRSAVGVPLASSRTWTFTTAAAPAGPSISSVTPAPGVGEVARTSTVTATFSVAMAADAFSPTSFRVEAPGGVEVFGTRTWDAATRRVTFVPSVSLDAATVYTATLTTDIRDANNTPLAATYTWSFTTASAPLVTTATPANGGTNVATGTSVSATFNVDMRPESLTNDSFKVLAGAMALPGSQVYDAVSRRVVLTPTSPLSPSTTYTAVLTGYNGVPIARSEYWSFTTAGVAPTVTAVSPAQNGSNISTDTVISATFSSDMNPASFTASTFTVTQGATVVSGSRAHDAVNRRVTFTPTLLDTNKT